MHLQRSDASSQVREIRTTTVHFEPQFEADGCASEIRDCAVGWPGRCLPTDQSSFAAKLFSFALYLLFPHCFCVLQRVSDETNERRKLAHGHRPNDERVDTNLLVVLEKHREFTSPLPVKPCTVFGYELFLDLTMVQNVLMSENDRGEMNIDWSIRIQSIKIIQPVLGLEGLVHLKRTLFKMELNGYRKRFFFSDWIVSFHVSSQDRTRPEQCKTTTFSHSSRGKTKTSKRDWIKTFAHWLRRSGDDSIVVSLKTGLSLVHSFWFCRTRSRVVSSNCSTLRVCVGAPIADHRAS